MSLRLMSLSSGSTGNAVVIGWDGGFVLADAGISYKGLTERLCRLGLCLEDCRGLLLTHEHIDHVSGLPTLLRKHPQLPVCCSAGCFEGLSQLSMFSRLPKGNFRLIKAGEIFSLGELDFLPIATSHDAREPLAFRGSSRWGDLALVTDLGIFPPSLAEQLQGLSLLYLEANHDEHLLEMGPYPYPLKLRIRSEKGHLSNEAAGKALTSLWGPELKAVLLAHLSQKNNYPPLALETVRGILAEACPGRALPLLAAAPARDISVILDSGPEDQT